MQNNEENKPVTSLIPEAEEPPTISGDEADVVVTEELAMDSAPPASQSAPQEHQNFFKKWGSLLVLGLALAIIVIDTTLLNVSIGTIIKELHTDIQSIQWIITAYSLTLVALTITGGRLGDLFGRKRMFMLGAILFAVGSFIASISTNFPTLLIGESIVEGIGAALMMPATSSLLVANFKGKDRALAFGVWGGIAGASAAIGPILGGWLTKNYSWRWGFRINIVVTLILLVGSILVKESRDDKEKPTLDILGVFLSATGLLAIVFGIIESSTYGWWKPKEIVLLFGQQMLIGGISFVPFIILFGLLVLWGFVQWEQIIERRGETPLVSMGIFANRTFTAGVTTMAMVAMGQVGLIFAMPVFLQSVLKLDALGTGLALLPLSISLLIMAPVSAMMTRKFAPRYIIITGLALGIVAQLVLWASISAEATVWSLAPGLALAGAGMGIAMAQISNITLSSVPVYQAGEASGINNTSRQLGSTLGSAIIGAVLLSALTTNLSSGIRDSAVIPESAKSSIINTVSQQSSNVEFGGGSQATSQLPPAVSAEIELIGKNASVAASQEAYLFGAIFAALGFLVAHTLPTVKAQGKDQKPRDIPAAGH
ncbi:MFS transporter [Candidatus Microgenomates bacterium]|nr:MFS transporter [Candidatus Microgenomates bacterium]